GNVTLQIACHASDRDHVVESIGGYVPEAVVIECEDGLRTHWTSEKPSVLVDFGLSNEFFLPLQTFTSFAIDPYIALLAALGRACDGECVALQVLFVPTRNPWDRATADALTDGEGG